MPKSSFLLARNDVRCCSGLADKSNQVMLLHILFPSSLLCRSPAFCLPGMTCDVVHGYQHKSNQVMILHILFPSFLRRQESHSVKLNFLLLRRICICRGILFFFLLEFKFSELPGKIDANGTKWYFAQAVLRKIGSIQLQALVYIFIKRIGSR
jgi:hypothetical protein